MTDDKRIEAESLFSRTFSASINRFSMIISFRKIAWFGLPAAIDQIFKESMEFSYDFYTNPENDRFFVDKSAALKAVGGIEGFGKRMTDNQTEQFRTAVDAASLIFAHSILDGAALDYCIATALVAPATWEAYVDRKKIQLMDFRGLTYDEILGTKIEEHLQSLEKESLLKKADRLFAVCKPPDEFAQIRGYAYDRDRLKALDKKRHEVVHGQVLTDPLPRGDEDVLYLMQTSFYFMGIVNNRFDLKIDSATAMSSIGKHTSS